MYEMLPCNGIGEATPTDDVKSIEAIRKKRDKSNAALIKSLREDEHAGGFAGSNGSGLDSGAHD